MSANLRRSGPKIKRQASGLDALRVIRSWEQDMRESSSKGLLVALLGACLLASSPAAVRAEAYSGQLGPVSRGSVRISLSVAPRLGAKRSLSGTVGIESVGTRPFCIWSNASIPTFSLSVSDLTEDGKSARPPFELEWSGSGAAKRPLVIRPGTTLAGLPAQSPQQCASETGRGAELTVKQAAFSTESRGSAVLLLIAPD